MRAGNHRSRFTRGYTLLELIVSSSVASILFAGLGSSLFIASQAFQGQDSAAADIVESDIVLAQMMREVQAATSFSELSANAITFTVPDRDGDSVQETIRYAWTGTPGDPLTFQINGGTVETIAADVRQFDLSYLSRFMPADESESGTVLFVSGEGGTDPPTTEEQKRINAIESWGFTVNVIRHTAGDEEFEKNIAASDVVYVSGNVSVKLVHSRLENLTIGIVCEQYELAPKLGFGSDVRSRSGDEIVVVDNSHFITSALSTGVTKILSAERTLMCITNQSMLAEGADRLADLNSGGNSPSLILLSEGDIGKEGRTIENRRVMLPWGTGAFQFDELDHAGLTIMQRSIEWAAEPSMAAGSSGFTLGLGDSSSDWWSSWLP